jgi:uncharacterized membrane protein
MDEEVKKEIKKEIKTMRWLGKGQLVLSGMQSGLAVSILYKMAIGMPLIPIDFITLGFNLVFAYLGLKWYRNAVRDAEKWELYCKLEEEAKRRGL